MTIDTHIDPVTERALTPSEVVARVRALVRSSLAGLVLEGEVSNRSTSGRGHLYFKVADADSAVACVAWKGMRGGLRVEPEDGQRVRVSVREGAYYGEKLLLVACQVEPIGEGALLERARKLLAQLAAEGLCEAARKRPLPRFPRACRAGRRGTERPDRGACTTPGRA
jgi:exodeoxyribonuclease VII large subunit